MERRGVGEKGNECGGGKAMVGWLDGSVHEKGADQKIEK